jgi:hypothetical protein
MTALEILNRVEPNGELLTTDHILKAMEEYAEQRSISFVDSLRDYERESHALLGFDERTTEELYQQFKKEQEARNL